MRKIISCMVCLTLLLLSMPACALGSDDAKQQFIENYLHTLDNTLKMQTSYMEDMQKNTIKLNVNGELSESTYQGSDAKNIKNIPCNASLEIIGNQKNAQGQLNFSGQYMDYQVKGTAYVSKDGLIIPKETIESLSSIAELGLSDIEELENMPAYLLLKPDLSTEEWAIIQESFNVNSSLKKDEMKAFFRALLNTIPANYFYYQDGYAVLELKTSLLSSVVFLNNIKDNSQDLADKFVAVMNQPPSMTDSEFALMKHDTVEGICSGINAMEISDISDMDLPFTVEEFKIFSQRDAILSSIHISDSKGKTFNFRLNSKNRLFEGKYISDISMDLLIDSPELFIDLKVKGTGNANSAKSYSELIIAGDIRSPGKSLSGKITLNTSMDFNNYSKIRLPEINKDNSRIIAMADLMPQKEDWKSAPDDGSLKVFIYGQRLSFNEGAPMIINSCTMVPLRETCDYLGCEVNWQSPDTIVLSDGYSENLTLKINSTGYYLGNKSISMGTAPLIINGRTYVPLRVVAEYFGYTLAWDEGSQSVNMEYNF